jgi:hydroxymethylpyrimidine/phosphomethylpyrimidine kinase
LSKHKYILTIAGHDPSGGAGITSDIKTFEAHGLYGLSVCTAITVQNDIKFESCCWVSTDTILAQIEIVFEQFEINVVKIGIIEYWQA